MKITDDQYKLMYDTLRTTLGTLASDPRMAGTDTADFFMTAMSIVAHASNECGADAKRSLMSLLLSSEKDRGAVVGKVVAAAAKLGTKD